MKDFHHFNVLGLTGVCFDTPDKVPVILLPFMVNGSLKDYLKKRRTHVTDVDTLPEVCRTLAVWAHSGVQRFTFYNSHLIYFYHKSLFSLTSVRMRLSKQPLRALCRTEQFAFHNFSEQHTVMFLFKHVIADTP